MSTEFVVAGILLYLLSALLNFFITNKCYGISIILLIIIMIFMICEIKLLLNF